MGKVCLFVICMYLFYPPFKRTTRKSSKAQPVQQPLVTLG